MWRHCSLIVPCQTLLSYIDRHPKPPVKVPWDVWGPQGSLIIEGNSVGGQKAYTSCGMRVLETGIISRSAHPRRVIKIWDFHPRRVATTRGRNPGNAEYTPDNQVSPGAPIITVPHIVKEVKLPDELGAFVNGPGHFLGEYAVLCEDGIIAVQVSLFSMCQTSSSSHLLAQLTNSSNAARVNRVSLSL